MNLTIQLITDEDLDEVMTIARASGRINWNRSRIRRYLKREGTVGLIARCEDVAAGTMFFSTRRSWIAIEGIQILPDCRRQGVGRAMLQLLTGGSWLPTVYQHVAAGVAEMNYAGCAFLEACGFVFEDVLPDYFVSPGGGREDGFVFSFQLKPKPLIVSTENQLTQPLGDPK
jgi:ribosomal protein S18 acetylase RimI-like enzyme